MIRRKAGAGSTEGVPGDGSGRQTVGPCRGRRFLGRGFCSRHCPYHFSYPYSHTSNTSPGQEPCYPPRPDLWERPGGLRGSWRDGTGGTSRSGRRRSRRRSRMCNYSYPQEQERQRKSSPTSSDYTFSLLAWLLGSEALLELVSYQNPRKQTVLLLLLSHVWFDAC